MTTIRTKLKALLVEHGLFDDDAEKVLSQYVESDIGKPMARRLDDKADDYPPQVMAAAWMGVKATAADWIAENCPAHWARSLFAERATP